MDSVQYLHVKQFLLQSIPYSLSSHFDLLGELTSLLIVQIPIHSCPWSANNCPPFASYSTLSHPTDQVTLIHCGVSTPWSIIHQKVLL
jgi:hypothetical protein